MPVTKVGKRYRRRRRSGSLPATHGSQSSRHDPSQSSQNCKRGIVYKLKRSRISRRRSKDLVKKNEPAADTKAPSMLEVDTSPQPLTIGLPGDGFSYFEFDGDTRIEERSQRLSEQTVQMILQKFTPLRCMEFVEGKIVPTQVQELCMLNHKVVAICMAYMPIGDQNDRVNPLYEQAVETFSMKLTTWCKHGPAMFCMVNDSDEFYQSVSDFIAQVNVYKKAKQGVKTRKKGHSTVVRTQWGVVIVVDSIVSESDPISNIKNNTRAVANAARVLRDVFNVHAEGIALLRGDGVCPMQLPLVPQEGTFTPTIQGESWYHENTGKSDGPLEMLPTIGEGSEDDVPLAMIPTFDLDDLFSDPTGGDLCAPVPTVSLAEVAAAL